MEKALTPGSLTFEQSLFNMIRAGTITQEEGLANADSANNLLWLINNTDAGADIATGKERKPETKPAPAAVNTSFNDIKLDVGDTERV
jgi:twitching motility protein PilU